MADKAKIQQGVSQMDGQVYMRTTTRRAALRDIEEMARQVPQRTSMSWVRLTAWNQEDPALLFTKSGGYERIAWSLRRDNTGDPKVWKSFLTWSANVSRRAVFHDPLESRQWLVGGARSRQRHGEIPMRDFAVPVPEALFFATRLIPRT
jgi:hypothetical protein